MIIRSNLPRVPETAPEETADAGSSLIQKHLLVHETVGAVAHPWDKHIFVVGTNHKAGSQLLRNIMAHFFDMLGATVSCQYHGHGASVTSLNRDNECTLFPAPIRFHNHISKDAILQMKKEAHDMKGDLRGVMIVREPLEMVASSYCYHHRGAEPTNPLEKGIPEMGPEDRDLGNRPDFLLGCGKRGCFMPFSCLLLFIWAALFTDSIVFRSFEIISGHAKSCKLVGSTGLLFGCGACKN